MEPIEQPENEQPSASFIDPQRQAPRTGIAPVWHTVVLILAVVAVSVLGMYRHPGGAGINSTNRISSYLQTVFFELVLVGWVAFGLRLRGNSLRSLIGKVSNSIRSIVLDAGIALLFWVGSMMMLATIGVMWLSIQTAITHKPIIEFGPNGQPTVPKTSEDEGARRGVGGCCVLSDVVRRRAWIRGSASDVSAHGIRRALQPACTVSAKSS